MLLTASARARSVAPAFVLSVALPLVALTAAACTLPLGAPPPSASASPGSSAPAAGATARATAAVPPVAPLAIDALRAKAHLDFMASPARGGRFTGSAGYDEAARYMAEQLAAAGVEPFGDGDTFFQRFKMPLVDLAATPTLERLGPQPRRFTHRAEFTEVIGGSSGGGAAEGRLVFAGSGQRGAALDDFAVIDVDGAIVMLLSPRSGALGEAVRLGAAGVLVVSDRMIKFSYVPRFEARTVPTLIVSQASADALLAGSASGLGDLRRTVEDQLRALATPGVAVPPSVAFEAPAPASMSLPLTPVRDVEATNVVGIVRGSDPNLAKLAVLVGGHLDGVGTDPDGTVFEAANDNASGPALTIELARSLVARRSELRLSVIVVAFAGEEQGLWGSDHFASRVSTVPGRAESLVAFLNLDVVGCCGAALSASEDSPSLFARAKRAAEAEGVVVSASRGSSDHVSFSRRRVEVLHLLWGDTGPIHTVRDTAATVTADRLGAAGRIAGRVVLELARGDAP
jgi:Zn-dependent M28 family amino/carboxypeptidase